MRQGDRWARNHYYQSKEDNIHVRVRGARWRRYGGLANYNIGMWTGTSTMTYNDSMIHIDGIPRWYRDGGPVTYTGT